MKTKTTEELVQGLKNGWFWTVGAPRSGVWGDNGTEFANGKMEDLCRIWGLKFAAGAPYSPWSNGINERNHHSCDRIVEKPMDKNPKMNLQEAVNQATWVHYTNITRSGAVPLTIMTGQNPKYPTKERLLNEEEVTLEEQVEQARNMQKIHLEVELEKIVKKCVENNSLRNNSLNLWQ